MAIILAIETSTSICSIALQKDGVLIGEMSSDDKGAHSERLMGMVKELLANNDLKVDDLAAVAVSEGPGSYTGLRIGVSTAKGLAFGLGLPLIGVSTLKAMATAVKDKVSSPGTIVAVLDARRMEVYRAIFDFEMSQMGEIESEIIEANSFSDLLESGLVYFVGDAVSKIESEIQHENARFLQIPLSAEPVGRIAFDKYGKGDFEDLAYFVPNYLKEFKALHSKKNPLLK